ncbi:MAG: acyl-CoA dehydrogenase family protein [Cyclobacteriaceae bacterium]
MYESNYSPNLLKFLPVVYVAWADAILNRAEIEEINNIIKKQQWLSEDEQVKLAGWLNPINPPSPSEIKGWLLTIQGYAKDLPEESKQSLIELAANMAAVGIDETEETYSKNLRALKDIEVALGVIGREHHRMIPNILEPEPIDSELFGETSNFPITELIDYLNGDQASTIAKIKTILAGPEFEYLVEPTKAEHRQKVLEWCQILAKNNIGNLAYPVECGGEKDMAKYFTAMETLSYHDLSMVIKFGVQFGLFGMSVHLLGTKKHHEKYLKDIGSLALPGCFAMTETGHGSNVQGIETTATYDHENQEFIINTPNPEAQKEYIGNAALHGQMATTFAQLMIDGVCFGVAALLVPIRDKNGAVLAGIEIEDCGAKLGLNGVDNGIIRYNNVRIPKENMLDRFCSVDEDGDFQSPIAGDNKRFFTMLATLVGGRIGVPRAGLSAAKSALTIAIRYGDKRKQFGPSGKPEIPILNYRTHQRRLLPLLANAYACHFALQYLTIRYVNKTEEDSREIESLAAGLKAYSTWNTTDTIQVCREACGGKGYLAENRFSALKADTDIFTTFEGDNTVLMQLVAKGRLTEFKQEFHDINLFGIVNYIADLATTSIFEKNPISIRRTDPEHLLDPIFHLEAFSYRERSILSSAAKRIKHHLDKGTDSFEAFNLCQYHMLNVGHAYIERVVLEKFLKGVDSAPESIKAPLEKLYQLYALSTIEKHKAWYLEQDYVEGVKTKAIRRTINDLCMDLRKDAVALVDAFDIPDKLLGAEIGRKS